MLIESGVDIVSSYNGNGNSVSSVTKTNLVIKLSSL